MKLIGNLLCIGFIVWVVSFFVKAEKKEFPSSEVLGKVRISGEILLG